MKQKMSDSYEHESWSDMKFLEKKFEEHLVRSSHQGKQMHSLVDNKLTAYNNTCKRELKIH